MRYVIAGCVVLAIAGAIFWLTRSKQSAPPKPAASAVTTSRPAPKLEHVRQLDPAARKELREKILIAQVNRRAISTAPELQAQKAGSYADDPVIPLEEAGPVIEALQETPQLMAKCYGDQPPDFRALARMTIVSDPDLGAVIDTDNIVDKDGKPIDSKIEECMRDTIDSLALPGMPRPGELRLEYTFRF